LLSKTKEVSEIEIGDDVVYLGKEGDFKDRIVTHRVIEKRVQGETYMFTTQGIANYEADPEITQDQIIGVVMCNIEPLSYISKMINNLYAFYFVIFLPLVLLVFVEVRRMVLGVKKEKIDERKEHIEEKANDEDRKE